MRLRSVSNLARQYMTTIGDAKRLLLGAGLRGDTLLVLVAEAARELARLRDERAAVREVLSARGFQPNGKRLSDAVDEALRLTDRNATAVPGVGDA